MNTVKVIGDLLDNIDYVISGRPMYERITNTPTTSKLFFDKNYIVRIDTIDVGQALKKLSKGFGNPSPKVCVNGQRGVTFFGRYEEPINLYYGTPAHDMIAWNGRKNIVDYVELVDGIKHLNPKYMLGKCLQLFDVHHGLMIYNYLRSNGLSHKDCVHAVERCKTMDKHVLAVLDDAEHQWSINGHVILKS